MMSRKRMNSYGSLVAIFLLLLSPAVFCMGHTMGSNPGCSGARLYEEYVRSKIIDDCDLLNNTLDIDMSKLSSKPGCIDKMRFHFRSETASKDIGWTFGRGTYSFTDRNPLASTDRCVKTTVTVEVFFRSQTERELNKEEFVLQVNPMANKCFGFTPDPLQLVWRGKTHRNQNTACLQRYRTSWNECTSH